MNASERAKEQGEHRRALVRKQLAERAVIKAAVARHELQYDFDMEATDGDRQAFAAHLGDVEAELDAAVRALLEQKED